MALRKKLSNCFESKRENILMDRFNVDFDLDRIRIRVVSGSCVSEAEIITTGEADRM